VVDPARRGARPARQGWSVIVPVKSLAAAKTRLRPAAPGQTVELALALALDTIEAALRATCVESVTVVSSDLRVAAAARDLGAAVLPDRGAGDLNRALTCAAKEVHVPVGGCGIAVLPADLPGLDPADLDAALRAAARTDRAFVADAQRTGTTLLTARSGVELAPCYGTGSALAHQSGGAAPLWVPAVTLRQDVDRPEDLDRLRSGPCGPRTLALVSRVAPDALRDPAVQRV
jgi:2-phospho-L-lactate guanylyltransferase